MSRIEVITKYRTSDRLEFVSLRRAEAHQKLCDDADALLERIGFIGRPEGTRFSNGHGYVQQNPGVLDEISNFLRDHGWTRDSDGILGSLGWTAECIDDLGRLWGQPFHAHTPGGGRDVIPVDGILFKAGG